MKDNKVGIAIIGCGQIAEAHAQAIAKIPDAELIAGMDIVEDRIRSFASQYHTKACMSLDEILSDNSIDAVILPLPHHLHRPVAMQCAKAGKHILVEKPMALNLDEAKQMVESADNAKVILMVGQSTRFRPEVFSAQKIIASGKLGQILQCIHQRAFLVDKLSTEWRYSQKQCGGLYVPLFSSHDVDMILWMMDDTPVRVNSILRSYTKLVDAESDGVIDIEFSNGAIATMAFSMNSNIYRYNALFIGTEGTLLIEDNKVTVNDKVIPIDNSEDTFTRQMREFVDAIRNKREPLTSGRKVLPTMMVLDAVMESHESQKSITVKL
ncbi:MAG: Gfo/Idh/MocA family oxidoreductase [Candidatus Poribacteria bacterium]